MRREQCEKEKDVVTVDSCDTFGDFMYKQRRNNSFVSRESEGREHFRNRVSGREKYSGKRV